MIEIRQYTITELFSLLNVHTKQGVDRKLQRYEVKFNSTGRAKNRIYEIEEITNPFKLYCIMELNISANVDFEKFKHFCLYIFCDEEFATYPVVQMSEILEKNKIHISRQTVSKSIRYLEKNEYIATLNSEYIYYAINKLPNGEKTYTEISKEKYSKGWSIYWNNEEVLDKGIAYIQMVHYIGGHPYKRPKIEQNAFYKKEIETLIELVNDTFL